MRQKVSLIAGILLIILGTSFLTLLGIAWDTARRMAIAFRGEAGPIAPEGWVYLLGGALTVAAGVLLVFRARRRP